LEFIIFGIEKQYFKMESNDVCKICVIKYKF